MEAGVHVDVEPRGIFTTLIPTQVLLQPGSTPGAVPDAAIDVAMAAPATARNATAGSRLPMQRWLFDVKTIFGGNGLYQCPRARDDSRAAPWRSEPTGAQGNTSRRRERRTGSTARRAPTPSSTGCARSARRAGLPSARTARPRPTCTRCSRWRPTGWRRGSGATWGRARRRRRARSSSPRCAGGWASSSAASSQIARHRIRRVPYIGVPRAVVERRMLRGQLIGGPQARVPLYVPYADFFQYQAGAGRTAGRPRVSAHGRRACRKAGAKRGPRRDGATRLIESRIVLQELQSARGIRSAYGSIGT